MKENKLDRIGLMRRLSLRDERPIHGGGNEILDEGEINDALLDE